MSEEDQFDPPGQGDIIDWKEIDGALLLIKSKQQKFAIPTKEYGPKDAIEVDLYVLDGPKAGEVYQNGYVFPLVLQQQLKNNIGGKMSLGRLGKQSTGKSNPAWKLADPTDSDKDTARRFLASDFYKKLCGGQAAAAAQASQATPAAPAADPWGSGNGAQAQPANVGGSAGAWGGDEPPF